MVFEARYQDGAGQVQTLWQGEATSAAEAREKIAAACTTEEAVEAKVRWEAAGGVLLNATTGAAV